MAKGDHSWRYSDTLKRGDIIKEGDKSFVVVYDWPAAQGPIFGKPGVPNSQYIPRKVRVKEL